MKLVKACIAMAAFAALLVVPSVASAAPEITHPTGTTAAVGTLIQGTNVAHAATPKVTVMTTANGPVECAQATLTGSITSNTGNHLAGNITTANFSGTPGAEGTAHCKSPLGNVTVTPSHSVNPVHENAAKQKIPSLPWCITANTLDDVFTVRGGACNENARPLTFVLHTPIGLCAYERASVTGTYTTHPNPAIATISKQNFVKYTGSVFCPANGELDMAFTLETHGANPTDVFIS